MTIIEKLAPIGKARSGKQRSGFLGVTIHNTGNTAKTATALAHANYLCNSGKNITMSWHYVIDSTNIYRCIPENEVAWHAGDGQGDGNFKTIAIEICMNPETNLLVATDNAAELTADILKRNGITDVRNFVHQHNRWSGKNCPQKIREGKPYNWETFLSKVDKLVNAPLNFEQACKKYLEVYPDVAQNNYYGTRPWEHYVKHGSTTDNPKRTWFGEKGQTEPQKTYLTVNTRVLPLVLHKGFNGRNPVGGRYTSMPKGSKVELLQKMNSAWYKVKYNGAVGYASAEYLK